MAAQTRQHPAVRKESERLPVQYRRDRPHTVSSARPGRPGKGRARKATHRHLVAHHRQPDGQGEVGVPDAETARRSFPDRESLLAARRARARLLRGQRDHGRGRAALWPAFCPDRPQPGGNTRDETTLPVRAGGRVRGLRLDSARARGRFRRQAGVVVLSDGWAAAGVCGTAGDRFNPQSARRRADAKKNAQSALLAAAVLLHWGRSQDAGRAFSVSSLNNRSAKKIHVILDNYGIHKSYEAREALLRLPRIQLHFLPPYCPDHNRIERMWEDLHANVTRNHRHTNLFDLCAAVVRFLNEISPWISGRRPLFQKVA